MRPGEAFYLPPGFWHEARPEESGSRHYTLSVHAISFASLVNMQLRQHFLANEAGRANLCALTPEARRALIDEAHRGASRRGGGGDARHTAASARGG